MGGLTRKLNLEVRVECRAHRDDLARRTVNQGPAAGGRLRTAAAKEQGRDPGGFHDAVCVVAAARAKRRRGLIYFDFA